MTPEGLTALMDVGTGANPFPGLRPFEFGESHLYFGRDGQSDQLIRKLASTRFVAVVGTSGSGKSSLVRAGLLPDLFSGFMSSAGSHWRIALMRPSNDPLGNLARALCATSVFGSEIEENAQIQTAITEATLRRGSLGLVEAVRQNRQPSNENLLVVVDQFEELFRFARVSGSEQYRYEAAAFVKLLLEAARQREHSIYVVLTMRSDFLGDCAQFWDLPEAINEGQYLIPRMTRDQRAEAITGPIAVCGGRVTQRLVNRLLNDTGDNPDMLPILQHALMRTWENWVGDHAEGETVDLRHYEAIGTMSDALSLHADEAWGELPDERSRRVAERVFKALTEKGEDNREVRRPTVLGELCALTGATIAEVVSVLDVFRREGRSFLMPPASVPLDEESLVDISHESLIRNWQRLGDWVAEEAQSARIYRRLAETTALHLEGGEGLLQDPALQIALDWREKHKPNATWGHRYHPEFDAAMSFLDASAAARDTAALEEERRRRRQIRRTRGAAILFFLLFMLSLAALAYARNQSIRAEERSDFAQQALERAEQANARAEAALADAVRERDRANAQTDIAQSNEKMAKGAKEEALKKKKEAEESKAEALKSAEAARLNARRAEVSRLEAEKQKSSAEAASATNRQLLYASDVTLAQQAYDAGDIARGRSLLQDHLSTSGEALGFEWFYLWNLFHGEEETDEVFRGHLYSVSLSADGNILALNKGNVVELRDATRRKLLRMVPVGAKAPNAFAISPDGQKLAFGSTGSSAVKLWDDGTGETSALEGHRAEVTSIAFSPDGKTLAVGTGLGDGENMSEVALWDVASRHRKGSFVNSSTVNSVVFSPDSQKLAIGGLSGPVLVRDVTSGGELCRLNVRERMPDEAARSIAFSPDGNRLAVATNVGLVWLFDMRRCREGNPLASATLGITPNGPENSPANAVAFSPDGKLIAVSYSDNTVKVWNSTLRASLATIKGHAGYINSVVFLPDSRTLVTGSEDDTIKLWDTEALISEQSPLSGHSSSINALAFSPDGKRLATGGNDKSVLLWDAEAGRKLDAPALRYDGPVYALAFSPDGQTLVTGADGPPLMLRDANTYKELGGFPQQHDKVLSAAFSPDGKRLVTCDGNHVVRLWSVASRGLLKEVELEGRVFRVAFSPDGKMIAAGTTSGVVKLWDAALSKELASYTYDEENPTQVYSIAFSPDGHALAAAFGNGLVLLLDAISLEVRGTLHGHKGAVYALAFSPDGRTIATGGEDGTIKLWAAASFKELIALRGHSNAVMSLAFSPDGQTLASASFDRTVRLWRAASKEKVEAGSP